jgi:8-oxo-dGTP pyrophosphatase MutT (NUDIX family)
MGNFETTVNTDDEPIGSKHWRDMQYEDIYRVSALWLTDNSTDSILLAQRKWTKKNDPGKWGAAAAGTLEVGETYESNIIKEIEEEIGLKGLKLKIGPKMYCDDGKHRFFCQWFIATVDKEKVDIVIQEDEVESVNWVSKSWLLNDLMQSPERYTPSMAECLRALGIH